MKKDLQIGDVLFYSGESFISRVISWVTKSPYTHVALVIGDNRLIEAQRIVNTDMRKIKPSEEFKVFRIEGLTDEQRQRIAEIAYTYRSYSYSYIETVGIFFRLLFKRDLPWFERANKIYCSELVDLVFYASGVPRKPERPIGNIAPHELFEVYELRKVKD